jgi:hypothetical protein
MEFKEFKQTLTNHFEKMIKDEQNLFQVNVEGDKMWETYLESFPPQYNQIYRERREHDCSSCRQFIRNFGNVVVIKNNKLVTLWDFVVDSEEYMPSVKALKKLISKEVVSDVYVSKFVSIGHAHDLEQMTDGTIKTWNHLHIDLPNKFVDKTSRSIGDILGQYRDVRNVFKRSLDELTTSSVETVLELIASNTLYKGQEWKTQLQTFLTLQNEYNNLSEKEKSLYTWKKSIEVGAVIGKIKNHSIGTLLSNISEGMDLELAVKKYEQIVAPTNYKRPQAIFTQKMLDEAKKTIEELGYMDTLRRRHAMLDDITVNNILFANRDVSKKINSDVFDVMSTEVKSTPKKFDKVEEISIDKFISDVLPLTKELEIFLEAKNTQRFVSLIAPQVSDAKTMFKWDNNFSWAYSGNVTDSIMKDRVKSAGGKVDGDLRFSIQWNDTEYDGNDLDAHCIELNSRYEIYYGNRGSLSPNGGALDVDIIYPSRNTPAVENITYASRNRMRDGKYQFLVNCFSNNGGRGGFRAEIEFDGEIYSFDYNKPHTNGKILVAEVELINGQFKLESKLPSSMSSPSKDIWGVKTNQFIPVSVVMYSPNYWNSQKGIGHQHVFFMLNGCVNPEQPNGFYNEFLQEDLMKHKRVFEALGGKMKVEEVDNQLSGLGFSLTQRGEIVVKVKGQIERIMKVKF